MKTINIIFLTALLLILNGCEENEESFLEINGVVNSSEIKSIILVKPNQDMRFDSIIELPIKDGKFHYQSKLDHPEAVSLMLGKAKQQGGRFMPLFLTNEKISLEINDEENFDDNIISGGSLNIEYSKFKEDFDQKFNRRLQPFQDSIKSLMDLDRYHSDKMKEILSSLKLAKNQDEKVPLYKKMSDLRENNLHLSTDAEKFEKKLEVIYREQDSEKQRYIESNPSIVSYSFLLDDLIFFKDRVNVEVAKKNFLKLSTANPSHPYNHLARRLIAAIENIKIGNDYLDFSAPDLNGDIIKLSEKIEGKVAILDLWATWCGPCIAKTRTMVPIFEEYRDKGFTIVGVAGEFKSLDRLFPFLEKEMWDWLQLVELDRENNIWQKYGVGNGGGALFLIDENGKVVAKDPTPEEVRNQIEAWLN